MKVRVSIAWKVATYSAGRAFKDAHLTPLDAIIDRIHEVQLDWVGLKGMMEVPRFNFFSHGLDTRR